VPAPDGVRPTTDRVRESLFARLGDLEGARVLDLYAGTGTLGVESISRGAQSVTFVERSGRSIKAIRSNVDKLGLKQVCQIVRGDAPVIARRLAEAGSRFDLIFLDPPYESGEVHRALEVIAVSRLLVSNGQVVVESAKRHPVQPVDGLVQVDERRYGDTLLTRLEPGGQNPPAEDEPPDDDW